MTITQHAKVKNADSVFRVCDQEGLNQACSDTVTTCYTDVATFTTSYL